MSSLIKLNAEVHDFPKRVETPERPTINPQPFFNRELSLLEFHARVLEEARDESNPLLERLKFLSIFETNVDEFFMIRVSGLKEGLQIDETHMLSLDRLSATEQLGQIRRRLLPLIEEQSQYLQEEFLPALKLAGIEIAHYESLTRHEQDHLNHYFREHIFPVLTPLAVDPSHPFPYISPLSLNLGLMVSLPEDEDSVANGRRGRDPRFVRIKVPS